MYDALFKVVIFGDGGVGKTALVNRYLTGLFNMEYKITVGVDFHSKNLEIEGQKVKLQIWDFAGENQFRFLFPTYVKGASGGIFMYDITRPSSLDSIAEWLTVIKGNNINSEHDFPIIIIGGKVDLQNERLVSIEDSFKVAKEHHLLDPIECSAKNGQNIEKIFHIITFEMMKIANLL